jgi:hypothetical protein
LKILAQRVDVEVLCLGMVQQMTCHFCHPCGEIEEFAGAIEEAPREGIADSLTSLADSPLD